MFAMEYKMKYCLFITVFVTGAAVLALELLGTRIISPFYGSTIYVWSSLISVTLVCLALGYFVGGRLADRRPRLTLLYAFILLAGLSVALLSLADARVLAATDALGPRWGALCSAFILFSLPMFFLGTIIPFAIKVRAKDLKDIGVTSGNLYAVSTVGSFAGAISTGFFLIPHFAVSTVMNMIACLMFAVVAMGFAVAKKYYGLLMLPLLPVCLLLPRPDIGLAENVKVIYRTESLYGQVMVVERQNIRLLLINGASQTWYKLDNGEFKAPYLRLMEKAANYHPRAETALVLGLGGGGMDRRLRARGLAVDNVELDPTVVAVAAEYFGFDGRVVVNDARSHVRRTAKRYDLVMFDVLNGCSVAPHLLTREAFADIKAVLSPGGILTVNTVGFESHLTTDDPYQKALFKTLKTVFAHVHVKATGYGFQNIVFYCADHPLTLDGRFVSLEIVPEENTPVLTDDYNPVASLTIAHGEAFRKSNIQSFGRIVLGRKDI
jgi:spermidine synthase